MSSHVIEQLSPFLDRELSVAEAGRVEAHLRECAACALRLQELAAVDGLARATDVDGPAGYFEGLPARVRERVRPVRPGRLPAWGLALAAGLALAVLTPLTLRERALDPSPAAAPADRRLEPAAPPTPVAAASDLARANTSRTREVAPESKRAGRAPARTDDARALGYVANAPAAAPPPAAPAPEGTTTAQKAAAETDQVRKDAPRAARRDAPAQHGPRAQAQAQAGYAAAPPEEEQRLRAADDKTERGGARPEPARSEEQVVAESADAVRDAAPPPSPDAVFAALAERRPQDAAEARELREAWRAFAQDHPGDPRADEARVRTVEAGAMAWRRSRDERDRDLARRDGEAYLRRPDAAQKERVGAVLRAMKR